MVKTTFCHHLPTLKSIKTPADGSVSTANCRLVTAPLTGPCYFLPEPRCCVFISMHNETGTWLVRPLYADCVSIIRETAIINWKRNSSQAVSINFMAFWCYGEPPSLLRPLPLPSSPSPGTVVLRALLICDATKNDTRYLQLQEPFGGNLRLRQFCYASNVGLCPSVYW